MKEFITLREEVRALEGRVAEQRRILLGGITLVMVAVITAGLNLILKS